MPFIESFFYPDPERLRKWLSRPQCRVLSLESVITLLFGKLLAGQGQREVYYTIAVWEWITREVLTTNCEMVCTKSLPDKPCGTVNIDIMLK